MTFITRRNGSVAAALALGVAIAGPTALHAQDYPTQPIQAIVPFAAGGFADTIGRIFAQGLSERLGQPIVVENQGGAGGNIGATRVAGADADGYTMLITTASITLSQSIYANLEYDFDDLEAAVVPIGSPEILAAHPSVPAGSLDEFLEWARAQDTVTFASAGVGTSSHLMVEYFLNHLADVGATHVGYSGGGPANQAAISGEVHLVGSSNAAYPFIREGLLNGVAIASLEEHDAVPGVGTFHDQGFENFTASSWVGIFFPAGTDPEILELINSEVNAMLDDADVQDRLREAGVMLTRRNVEETQDFVRSEVDNWRTMVEAVGVEVQ